MKHTAKVFFAAAMSMALLSGCGSSAMQQATDLTAGISVQAENGTAKTDDFVDAQYHFTVSLLQAAARLHPQENQLTVPYLAGESLLMAAAGAEGETHEEIRAQFGGADLNSLTQCFTAWKNGLPSGQLRTAESVWIKDSGGFEPKEAFLTAMRSRFQASVYAAPFNDTTVSDMNTWVSGQTEGTIPEFVQSLEPNEVLMLLNAGVFEAKWCSPFADNEVRNSLFNAANGAQQNVPFLCKEMDEAVYIESEDAVGFMRDYQNRRFAFAALVPQSAALEDYIAGLTPESLRETLNSGIQTEVDILMPKFSFSQESDLKPVFQEMGVQLAYQEGDADFSGISDGKLYLNRSLQYAQIAVDEGGTTASYSISLGAEESACSEYRVTLNKPFLFMVYDREYGLPVLAGTVQSVG